MVEAELVQLEGALSGIKALEEAACTLAATSELDVVKRQVKELATCLKHPKTTGIFRLLDVYWMLSTSESSETRPLSSEFDPGSRRCVPQELVQASCEQKNKEMLHLQGPQELRRSKATGKPGGQ